MRNTKGFTLIELMIVVVIVGILASVALTSYQSSSQKSHRTDAKNKLFEAMQREERYFSENNTYVSTLSSLGYTGAVTSDNGYYIVTATANGNGIADGVILTATRQGTQANDTTCGDFILNSNGTKSTTTGAAGCW